MYHIYLMDYPEDIFAKYHEFDTPQQAAVWIREYLDKIKERKGSIIVHKRQWKLDNMFGETILDGEFIKGYELQIGAKKKWVRISKI